MRQYLVLSLPGKLSETRNFPSPRTLTPSSAQYDTKSPDLTTYIYQNHSIKILEKQYVTMKTQRWKVPILILLFIVLIMKKKLWLIHTTTTANSIATPLPTEIAKTFTPQRFKFLYIPQ